MPQRSSQKWKKRHNRSTTPEPMERGDVLARKLWKRGVISIQTAGVTLPPKTDTNTSK